MCTLFSVGTDTEEVVPWVWGDSNISTTPWAIGREFGTEEQYTCGLGSLVLVLGGYCS